MTAAAVDEWKTKNLRGQLESWLQKMKKPDKLALKQELERIRR